MPFDIWKGILYIKFFKKLCRRSNDIVLSSAGPPTIWAENWRVGYFCPKERLHKF